MFRKIIGCWWIILVVSASPIPKTKFDQTQHGELNVRADLDNILILFVPPGGIRLVDNQQIGNILQIFSNSRRNPPTESSAPSDSPYKVEIDQSAIDKLQSDVDSINSVIPFTKNYDPQKKDTEEVQSSSEPNPTTESKDVDKPDPTLKPEVESTSKPIQTDTTTIESIITSRPIQHKIEIIENVQTKKPSVQKEEKEKATTKVLQRTTQVSQQRAQNVRPAHSVTTPKKQDEENPHEKRVRLLQMGVKHCSPGERLTESGNCVEIVETEEERESRQRNLDRLLENLRFGLSLVDDSR